MSTMTTIYRKKEGVAATPLDNYYLIFPNHTDEENKPYICKLNQTSYFMFDCIDGMRTIEDIVDISTKKYNAPRQEIENDIIDLFVKLESKRIIIKDE